MHIDTENSRKFERSSFFTIVIAISNFNNVSYHFGHFDLESDQQLQFIHEHFIWLPPIVPTAQERAGLIGRFFNHHDALRPYQGFIFLGWWHTRLAPTIVINGVVTNPHKWPKING